MAYEVSGVHHTLSLNDRSLLTLGGIKEVIGFDERTISVVTQVGALSIEGQNLHIDKLNVESGDLIVTGEISGLMYRENDGGKKSFLQRLFG